MAEKKRGLGRGLNLLLSNTATAVIQKSDSPSNANDIRRLPTELMRRGKYQPRREMSEESLRELAESIRTQGILQPIVVRTIAKGQYEIIAGERRWRAAQLAGLTEVPVMLRDVSDEDAMAIALIENIQRENLNPIEEAIALQRLLDEFQMTHQQIAEAVGKSRTTITNLLRLMGLYPDVKHMLERGELEMGHARAILALEGIQQLHAANKVVSQRLSVRETEQLVRKLNAPAPMTATSKKTDADVHQLQQQLSETLGALVSIAYNAKGKGKLTIQYNSLLELEGILEHIR